MSYNDETGTFEATDQFKVDGSSLVEEVAYDSDSNELLVYFRGGNGYVYKGVPKDTFTFFRTAHSKGQYYNNHVKRSGFGYGIEVDWDTEIVDKGYEAPAMTSVTGPTQFSLTANSGNQSFVLPNATFSLSQPEPVVDNARTVYDHTVHYTVEGGNKVHETLVEAGTSWTESQEKVEDLLDALGLDYTIKGVYISLG